MEWLYVAIIIVALGLAIFAVFRHEKNRSAALQRLAAAKGWRYTRHTQGKARDQIGDFRLFDRGGSQEVSNVIAGESNGHEFALFDYRYTRQHGNNRSTHRQSVVWVHAPGFAFPAFELRPESFLAKVGSQFGYQDIDFDASPTFSAQYLLRGDDEPKIRRLFDAGVRRYFEAHPGWFVEGQGHGFIAYRERQRVKPAMALNLIEKALKIARRLEQGR